MQHMKKEKEIMAQVSIHDQLANLSKTWSQTKAKEAGQFKEIEDGEYPCICKQARLENAKSSGRFQIAWMWRVIKGSDKNKPIYIYTGLETDDNLAWCKSIFISAGVKPPKKIVNLPASLEKMIDKKASITVQTSGNFSNKYVNPLGKTAKSQDEEEDLELEDL